MLELLFVRPRYGLPLSRDANFIKIIFNCDVTNDLHDIHSELVNKLQKVPSLVLVRSLVLEELKHKHTLTERISLYSIDSSSASS